MDKPVSDQYSVLPATNRLIEYEGTGNNCAEETSPTQPTQQLGKLAMSHSKEMLTSFQQVDCPDQADKQANSD